MVRGSTRTERSDATQMTAERVAIASVSDHGREVGDTDTLGMGVEVSGLPSEFRIVRSIVVAL